MISFINFIQSVGGKAWVQLYPFFVLCVCDYKFVSDWQNFACVKPDNLFVHHIFCIFQPSCYWAR